MRSLGWFSESASLKKRPPPPSASGPSAKRPKQIPFVTESDSEDDSCSGHDDENNDDENAPLDLQRLSRRSIGEGQAFCNSRDNSLRLMPNQQRQVSTGASGNSTSMPRALAPRANKSLNKARLGEMLLAKNKGRAATTGSRSTSPLTFLDARNNPRARPLNATQADVLQQEVSLLPGTTPMFYEGAESRRNVQDKRFGQSEGLLRKQRNQAQDTLNDATNVKARKDRALASNLTPKDPRDVKGWPSQISAHTKFINHTLSPPHTAYHCASRQPGIFGGERRGAMSQEVSSAKLVENIHTPEVSERSSHTSNAGKSNMQDRRQASRTGATAAKVAQGNEISVSWNRNASSVEKSAPASKQIRRQNGGSKSRSAPVITSHRNSSPAVNSKQAIHTSRQVMTQSQAHRGLLSAASSDKTHLARASHKEQTNVTAQVDSIDMTETIAPKPSSTKPHAIPQHDEAISQKTSISTKTESVESRRILPQGSPGFYRVSTTMASEAQPMQRAHTTDASRAGSSEVDTSQQDRTKVIGLGFINSDSYHRPSNAERGEPRRDLEAMAPAPTQNSRASKDAHVPETVPDKPLAAVANPDTQSTVPVAIMLRPEKSVAQTPIRHRPEVYLPPVAPVSVNDTIQTVRRSGKTRRLSPSPRKLASGTSTGSGANPSNSMTQVADSAAAQHVYSNQSQSSVLDQSSERMPEFSGYNHVSGRAPAAADLMEKPLIQESHLRHDTSTLIGLKMTQPITSPPNPRHLTLGVNVADAQPTLGAAVVSSPIAMESPLPPELSTAASQSPSLRLETESTLLASPISPTAEPYFEYSIQQSLSLQSSTAMTELSVQPFTSLNGANTRAVNLFQSTKQQYEILGMQCTSTITRLRVSDLPVNEATFISIYDPSQTLTLKIWVERAEVGIHANHTPLPTPSSPLISKTLYAVRLWRLAEIPTDADSDSEPEAADSDSDSNTQIKEKEILRIYHPLPQICTEIHTSLQSANLAAKRVQIALSHEVNPKSMQAKWQTENLRDLSAKLESLRREAEDEDGELRSPSLFEYVEGRRTGYWRSVFNGSGPGGCRFEVLVVSVGVSGPRNL